jgi:hypothetical protein
MTHMALRVFGSYRNMVQTLKARLPQRSHGFIRDWGRGEGKGDVSRHRWPIVLGIVGAVASGPSLAQDFTEGKSPAQLFAGDCAACHKSPQGLAKSDARSVASFLREHYTTKPEMADALAAYLLSSGRASAASNDAGRPESSRNGPNRNADLRPRAPIGTGDDTKPPDSGEGPKPSAKLHGTGKPTDSEPRRVRSTAATEGVESTDEKDGAKPQLPADDEAVTDVPKPKPRAASREGLPPVPAGKLNAYARSGTSDKDRVIFDSGDPRLSKLRAYANSGEGAPPAVSAPPKAVASPPPTAVSPIAASPPATAATPIAAIPPPTAISPSPTLTNSPPADAATAPANPGPSSDGERAAVTEQPKAPSEDATHADSIDASKPIVDEGSKPPKPHRSQDGASARPTGRTDSAANVPTSPMSFLGRILSGGARQTNPN